MNVGFSGWLPRLGKRELFFAIDYSYFVVFVHEGPLPLGAWLRLRYFIVVLPGPSIELFCCIKQSTSVGLCNLFVLRYP